MLGVAALSAGLAPSGVAAQSASNFKGSVSSGQVSAQPLDLTLDDAMQRGLRTNLGIILSGTQTDSARAQR